MIPQQPILRAVIAGQLYVAQHVMLPPKKLDGRTVRCFQIDKTVQYDALCDDFGPMNLSSIVRFVEILDQELVSHPACSVVFCVENGKRFLTNGIFLLGAYMILKLNKPTCEISEIFKWVNPSDIEPFRDATHSQPDFGLNLVDCWLGMEKGIQAGWVALPSPAQPRVWGKFDIDEYNHYEDPLNADLHEVVPGKFIAFRGPKYLGGRHYYDCPKGYRDFSPSYYIEIFKELDVTAVIRLNEPEYDGEIFQEHGINHYNLEFEDCTAPPAHIVRAFFDIVDSARGAVAVHCKAGLGRTGTLIALYLMRSHSFEAREAMGWLRIVRPGSVIGAQQHYLCGVGSNVRAGAGDRFRIGALPPMAVLPVLPPLHPLPPLQPQATPPSPSALAEQVAHGMQRRAARRRKSHPGESSAEGISA